MSEQIEILARQKSFAQLTDAERILVLSVMSAESFQQVRRVLQMAPDLEQAVAPPPQLRANLLRQFARQTPAPSSLLRRCIMWRIPVWQVAIAAALVFGMVLLPGKKELPVPPAVIQTVVQTKPVFQDRIVWKERVIIRYKTIVRDVSASTPPTIKKNTRLEVVTAPEDWLPSAHLDSTAGKSLAEQPELLQFFTQPFTSDH